MLLYLPVLLQNSMWLDTMGNPSSPISGDLANTCLIVMFSTKIGQFQESQQVYLQHRQLKCSRHFSCWHSYYPVQPLLLRYKKYKSRSIDLIDVFQDCNKIFYFQGHWYFFTLSFHLIIYCRELDTMHLNAGRRKILVGFFNYQ